MYQSFCPLEIAMNHDRMLSPVIVIRAPEYNSIKAAIRYTPCGMVQRIAVAVRHKIMKQGASALAYLANLSKNQNIK